MTRQNEKLIDMEKAAEILDGSKQYVRTLIQNDELQGAKLGGKYFTSEEAIQRAVFGQDADPQTIPPPSPSSSVGGSDSVTALAKFE